MRKTNHEYLNGFFTPAKYTATKWNTREDKQKFALKLVRFVESGYNPNLFHKELYTRLSMCFGHIPHFNKYGFYEEWFSTPERQADWVNYVCERPVYGDPGWTYSDVERDIRAYARTHWRS